MKKDLLVYIAGPYSHPDPVENTHNAVKVADKLLEAGLVPYIPHLSLLWHAISPKPYETWLAYDIAWLKVCNALLRLPGESSGADKEVVIATDNGIPVFEDVGELFTWSVNK